jgi:hypothetical protein
MESTTHVKASAPTTAISTTAQTESSVDDTPLGLGVVGSDISHEMCEVFAGEEAKYILEI